MNARRKKEPPFSALKRTLARVTLPENEPRADMKTPLNEAGLWEVHGSGYCIKSFGKTFYAREYVLAKTYRKALELARIKTGIHNICVTHPDFPDIL